MTVIIVSFIIIMGAAFTCVAALGALRMPDLYCRMHAATKAGAFGVSLLLVGLSIALPEPRIIIQSICIIVFFYLTAPISGQMIGRVAVERKIPQWRASSSKRDI